MSYYDFDDHFWAPHEVCAQAPQAKVANHPFSLVKEWLQIIFTVDLSGESMERFQSKNSEKAL